MTRAFLIGWVFLLLACRVLAEQLTLVGINDTHARLDRMPRLAALVGQLRQEDPDLILLSAGDHNTGNPVSDMDPIYSGRPMIELFNLMGVDVSCVGNHEFDRGMAALARQMRESRFPYVCANMQAPPSTGMRLVPWVILERKGLRIGVLGLVTVEEGGYPTKDGARKLAGLHFTPPEQELQRWRSLRKQCDVLVLLTHVGYDEDRRLARLFPEADVIIGGHSGTLVRDGKWVDGVLVTQAGDRAEAVTKVVLDVEGGRVRSARAQTLMVDDVQPDAGVQARVEAYASAPVLREVLGICMEELNWLELGCVHAEALRSGIGAEVAMMNLGGIRLRSLPRGSVTLGDIYRMDPFANTAVRLRVRGAELPSLVEGLMRADSGRPPCVAGMSYELVRDASGQYRVSNLKMADGSLPEPDREYLMATHSYVRDVLLQGRDSEDTGRAPQELLRDWLRDRGRMDASYGRAVRLPEEAERALRQPKAA